MTSVCFRSLVASAIGTVAPMTAARSLRLRERRDSTCFACGRTRSRTRSSISRNASDRTPIPTAVNSADSTLKRQDVAHRHQLREEKSEHHDCRISRRVRDAKCARSCDELTLVDKSERWIQRQQIQCECYGGDDVRCEATGGHTSWCRTVEPTFGRRRIYDVSRSDRNSTGPFGFAPIATLACDVGSPSCGIVFIMPLGRFRRAHAEARHSARRDDPFSPPNENPRCRSRNNGYRLRSRRCRR